MPSSRPNFIHTHWLLVLLCCSFVLIDSLWGVLYSQPPLYTYVFWMVKGNQSALRMVAQAEPPDQSHNLLAVRPETQPACQMF